MKTREEIEQNLNESIERMRNHPDVSRRTSIATTNSLTLATMLQILLDIRELLQRIPANPSLNHDPQ